MKKQMHPSNVEDYIKGVKQYSLDLVKKETNLVRKESNSQERSDKKFNV